MSPEESGMLRPILQHDNETYEEYNIRGPKPASKADTEQRGKGPSVEGMPAAPAVDIREDAITTEERRYRRYF